MKKKITKIMCPVCHQDLRDKPHLGYGDCRLCGQGVLWKKFAREKKQKREKK